MKPRFVPIPDLWPRVRLGAAVLLIGTLAATVAADDSLARAVPADIGLFVELRQAEDLLSPLVEPQVWLTLAEMVGQPAALDDTEQWRRRVEQTVRMSPADAVRALFSQRVAFAAEGPRNTQDAVVLCRPAGPPRTLIQQWQAQPLPTSGRTAVYRLPYQVGLAVRDDLLVFGDRLAQTLFDEVVQHLDGHAAGTLAEAPAYRQLLSRVPPNPDGVLFARLTRAAAESAPPTTTVASAPAPSWPELPRLLQGSSHVLLALHRDGRLLHVTVVGDAAGAAASPDGRPLGLLGTLPRRTLLAWAGHVDYAGLAELAQGLPERSVFRVAYQLHERAGTIQRMTAALNSATCVAVGLVDPPTRQVTAPPVPAVALLVRTREPMAAIKEWADLFHHTVALYKLLSLKLAAPPRIPPIESTEIGGLPAERLDLGGLIAPAPELTPIGELHLCWTLDDDVLILASHADWLRQIIEARHAQAERLDDVLALARLDAGGRQDNTLVAQVGPLADLGKLWLRYFERTLPFVLQESWWRNYQPGGGGVRLGLQVTEDAERRRLRVLSVSPNSPADGLLRPGDEIVGCNGRRFTTSQPVQEMRRGLNRRPNARWIDLWIERNRIVSGRRIPLLFVDPVEVLRRIVAVGQVVQRVVYTDDLPDAAGPRGRLTLELRTEPGPLFELRLTPTEPNAGD